MAEHLLPYHLFLPLLVLVPILYLIHARRRCDSSIRLPPSPWSLPIIGHLHHLAGKLPHRAMRELSRRHGPVMLLQLCELPLVVASSAAAAQDIMKTQDVAFANRPMSATGRVLHGDSAGLVFAPYGDGWRQLRRICTLELLSARRVRSFRRVREEEVGRLILPIASSPPGQAVNLSERIAAYVADSAVRAIIGSRFRNRDAFLRILERRIKIMPARSLPDLFPSSRLAMRVSRMPSRMKRERREMMEFIETIVQEHQESRSPAEGEEEDLLDVLLRIQRDEKLSPPLTTEDIKTVIIEIFVASSETSATALQWVMAELIRNPRVLHKAQDEIRRSVRLDGQQVVAEDSLDSLHYLDHVIKEGLRLHPPGTLLLPRETRAPCKVLGFDVPVGAMVLINAWAIGRDPSYWEAPEEFMPERFEGNTVDFKGNDFEYIPFGAGRRMCPGMTFGLANMKLALANLLYHFDWKLPDGIEPVDLDITETLGITTRRRSDLLLIPAVHHPL